MVKNEGEKNKEGLLSTLAVGNENTDWGFKNLKYIKIISIEEDVKQKEKEAYIKIHLG